MKYLLFFIICILTLCSYSCNDKKELPTYTITSQDFENALNIDGYVEPVNIVTINCPPDVDGVINSLVEDGTIVNEGDIVCTIEYQQLQTNYDETFTSLETRRAHLNKTRADLDLQYAILDAQVKNNDAQADIAQLDSLQIEFVAPSQKRIKELELKKVAIEKEKLQQKLKALAVINQSEIRRIELEIKRLSNRLESIKEKMDALTLKAPKKGLALRAHYRESENKIQIGDPVWSPMTIIMIPDMDIMKVKIKAPEADYKAISIGDSVVFTFDAMPGNMAWGRIKIKSPVGHQYKKDSKVKFFDIEASIDSSLVIPEPGLSAKCKIILKTVKDTIVVPQIAINEEDSMRVVYVKKGQDFEIRQIEIGTASRDNAIVSKGLERGDIISLIKPETSQIKSKVLFQDTIQSELKDSLQTDTIKVQPINNQDKNENN